MVALRTVFQEQLQNLYLIWRLSLYEAKKMYAANLLGNVWVFLAPFLQVAVYWVVFGFGIRQGADVNGIPFLIWMMRRMIRLSALITPAITKSGVISIGIDYM